MGVYTADDVVVVKKVPVKELSGFVLDYFVAKASGTDVIIVGNGDDKHLTYSDTGEQYSPSTDWAQGGQIIERFGICVSRVKAIKSYHWVAGLSPTPKTPYYGDTPLIAAMRCLVGNAIGDEVQANVAWLY